MYAECDLEFERQQTMSDWSAEAEATRRADAEEPDPPLSTRWALARRLLGKSASNETVTALVLILEEEFERGREFERKGGKL